MGSKGKPLVRSKTGAKAAAKRTAVVPARSQAVRPGAATKGGKGQRTTAPQPTPKARGGPAKAAAGAGGKPPGASPKPSKPTVAAGGARDQRPSGVTAKSTRPSPAAVRSAPAPATAPSKPAKPAAPAAKPRGAAPASSARPGSDPQAAMTAWQSAMTPGDGHRRLEPIIGSWEIKSTFWGAPDAPPEVTVGSSEHRWVLGGRFVAQVYRGTFMGRPFDGLGYTGYDNVRGRYVGAWMDTLGTGMMHSVGTGKATASRLAFTSTMIDPAGGDEQPLESLITIQDGSRHTYEMWTKTPNGKRHRMMLLEYTRRKS